VIVLAVILLVVVAVLVVLALTSGTTQDLRYDTFAGSFSTSALWVFVAGAVAGVLALFALSLLRRGTRRRVARRREIKRLRKVEAESGPVPTTSGQEARRTTAHEGYDEPDRQLRRDPVDDGTDRPAHHEA
jgi:uncharacterized integral membrane protein